MTIHKFGGSNFGSSEAFQSFLKIIKEINAPNLIVISALGKTTRRLAEALELAEKGNLTEALDYIEKLKVFTINLTEQVINSQQIIKECLDEIEIQFGDIENYLRNIYIIRELTSKTRDKVLSYGEKLASIIFNYFLKDNSIDFALIDATDIIKTDNNFGKANPLEQIIEKNIKQKVQPLLLNSKIVITQGFIGSTEDGEITTMGFESSNLTALLFAQYLDANEITIWTDVEGVYNIDPNVFSFATQIPKLSYYQAKLAAKYGNKLFYPKMIKYAKENNIKINYRSLFNPEGKCTIISDDPSAKEIMYVFYDELYEFKLNLETSSTFERKITEYLVKNNEEFVFTNRYSNELKILTNKKNLLPESTEYRLVSGLIIINPNILKIYKNIIDFSNYFVNFDYTLYPLEENISLLTFIKTDQRDTQNLLKIVINKQII